MDEEVPHLFRESMAGLCSGVAVVTARRPDGHPCGLVATSISSFSADPPSVLVSIAHTSRCHQALADSRHFGVHLLRVDQEPVARVFAGVGDDKFGDLAWGWDEHEVPRLRGALSYLRCRRSALFELYDHSVLIGDIVGGAREDGDPLIWMARSMQWRLERTGLPAT